MGSSALTLGRAKGGVFWGQALTLTVPVQMDGADNTSALCFNADVFYGDARQDTDRVSVTSTMQSQTQSVQVIVSSHAPVDEPVVTVYMRAGCENKTTRRYVVLAELAATVVTPPIGVGAAPAASQAPQFDKKPASVPRSTRLADAPALGAQTPGPRPVPAARSAPRPPKAEGPRAHLKLAPLDLSIEHDSTLKLSNELAVEGGEDLQKRARAVALWRSLSATPQESLIEENRRQALESDLKGLHAITVKNSQLLDDMTRRLGKAESGRYSNPLVYGLLAAVVLLGSAIGFMWSRATGGQRSGGPWWGNGSVGDKSESVPRPGAAVPAKVTGVPPQALQPLGVADVDIDLPVDDAVAHTHTHPQPIVAKLAKHVGHAAPGQTMSRALGHVDFAQSKSAALLRSIHSKEMLDVRQQAEFFMALGQHQEAVKLLRDSVDSNADANPLVFLELLKVFHTLGRKSEYDHYRIGFNAIFSGQVPAYSEFSLPGSGLEAYPAVCNRIVALWPSDEVVAYIENCLVRPGNERGGQGFDLEAFRDLLLLHAMASRISSSSFESGFMPFSAARSAPALAPTGATDVDVDLDLSESRDDNLIDFGKSGWSR